MAVVPQTEKEEAQKGSQKLPEPKVMTEDVRRILYRVVRPDDEDAGASVIVVAEAASTSARTIYRILSKTTETISLDLADRVAIACGGHLATCRLVWPDGRIQWYLD